MSNYLIYIKILVSIALILGHVPVMEYPAAALTGRQSEDNNCPKGQGIKLTAAGELHAGDTKLVSKISVDQAQQMLNEPDTVIIDVRKPKNWWRTSKKIYSAVREDPSKVDQWAAKYTKDQTLIFY